MAARKRPRRTDQHLQVAATHLAYEFDEFMLDALRSGENAFFEAHLLHARTLIEFLIGRPKGRSRKDIAPEDFVAGWVVPDTPGSRRLASSLLDIDQHLSHLSWTRATWMIDNPDDPRMWRYLEIVDDMYELYSRFVAIAQQEGAPGSSFPVTNLESLKLKIARSPN
jgi:hypothetical protein